MKRLLFTLMTTAACLTGSAQGNGADSTVQQKILSRLHVGGYSKQSDAYKATEKFYKLKKSDRLAVIKFIEAI